MDSIPSPNLAQKPEELTSSRVRRASIDSVRERVKIAQNFEFPPLIKASFETSSTEANAWAVTSTLFAGILVSILQTISDEKKPSLEALRFFLYSAIVVNVSGASFALYALMALADVPEWTGELIAKKPLSVAYKVARGETIPPRFIGDDQEVMKEFHPYPGAFLVAGIALMFTCWIGTFLTFISIAIWIWVSTSPAVAGAVMIWLVPCCLALLVCMRYNMKAIGSDYDEKWAEKYQNQD